MTQPALSIQLKAFQQQFRIPLTEIVGRRVRITDFGREIAALAEDVLSTSDSIQYKTKEYEGLLTGQLRIASASTGKYVIPYFVAGFINEHSGIDLTLDVTNKSQVIESLKLHTIDFALVSTIPEGLEINSELLLENRLYLVSNQPQLNDSRPYLFREEGSATRKAMDEYLGPKPNRRRIELISNEVVKQGVIAGLGYSLLPLIGIKHELASGELFIIKSKGLPIVTSWRLIWLPNRPLTPIAKAFLQYIRQNKEALIAKWWEKAGHQHS
jgi:DNA-binding transcriptional LysR family regulator